MEDSEIVIHASGSITLTGDGIKFMKAITLRQSLKLWQKTGIIPTRGVGITAMLRIAHEFTGKNYKRTQAGACIDDLSTWIETMRAALPRTDNRVTA